jgi:sulfofructose kinase
MVSIVCVGHCVMDYIFRVGKLPERGGKYSARDFLLAAGGPAATAAATAARLGAKTAFLGRVGDDGPGREILAELAGYGVDVSQTRRVAGASSSLSAILVDPAGERVIVNYRDPGLPGDAAWITPDMVAGADVLLADVRWLEGAVRALTLAAGQGVPTVLDADVTDEDMAVAVGLAGHVVFSEPGLARFTGLTDPAAGLRRAAERTKGVPYVTLGGKGCLWLEGSALLAREAFPVAVADTTGAGDVFHGAFAVALARGLPAAPAAAFAGAAAALKCSRSGGWAGIPTLDEVLRFLEGQGCGLDRRFRC